MTTYTAPNAAQLRAKAGTRAEILAGQLELIDAKFDEYDAASVLGELASGKIIVGNSEGAATDVDMSGDATIDNTGAITIAAGAVEESMISSYAVDGLHTKRIARATFDFAASGGDTGSYGLGVTLPDNSVITRSWYTVESGFTSADSTATIALTVPTDDVAGIAAVSAISENAWDAGHHEGIQDGAAANFSKQCTAARELTLTIGVQAITAGKLVLFCEYVILD